MTSDTPDVRVDDSLDANLSRPGADISDYLLPHADVASELEEDTGADKDDDPISSYKSTSVAARKLRWLMSEHHKPGGNYHSDYLYLKLVSVSQIRSILNSSLLMLSNIHDRLDNARILGYRQSDDLELAEGETQIGISMLRDHALFMFNFIDDSHAELFDTDDRIYKLLPDALRRCRDRLMPGVDTQARITVDEVQRRLDELAPGADDGPLTFGPEVMTPLCNALTPWLDGFRPGQQVEDAAQTPAGSVDSGGGDGLVAVSGAAEDNHASHHTPSTIWLTSQVMLQRLTVPQQRAMVVLLPTAVMWARQRSPTFDDNCHLLCWDDWERAIAWHADAQTPGASKAMTQPGEKAASLNDAALATLMTLDLVRIKTQ
ncbi:hypothetical protein J4E85_010974 [Alternaria conjuncta]|uniref:uncharacterized protein n=1 Tax=Alternaria conjuncta TaxID=181017 RepID=UPI00221FDD6A|nr:uncharacterized protein J4E85_010974 [Alternaria conjuncta]KAI4912999.1 hypothetical protein J4E85_010974 [Alternaria conjuncta]